MTYINITDDNNEEFEMPEDLEVLEINPWIVLNMDEIACTIAYDYFDSEEDISQEIIDTDISEFLHFIHNYIFDRVNDKLLENGRLVI